MKVRRLIIQNLRGVRCAELYFEGHTLLVGGNNVGKSTICEALDLVLGPDRLRHVPAVDEYDFYNGIYLDEAQTKSIPIQIEAVLTDLSAEVLRLCAGNEEYWHKVERRLLDTGEIETVDSALVEACLRLVTIAKYDPSDDEFEANTYYAHSPDATEGLTPVRVVVKRALGFIYLRALRTGSRALSLDRGSLLDTILRMKEVQTGLWERTRSRLRDLEPRIDDAAQELGPILNEIEQRLAEYIPRQSTDPATRLFVSQLTREHLRKTIWFFLSLSADQQPVPFQQVGTGTLNTLVLALLTFIAEIKKENVIFAMEEPEIALPPHTQRRIVNYLLHHTTQCFVTSHSPYIIERFEPDQLMLLHRDATGQLDGVPVVFPEGFKVKTYRQQLRRSIAEAILGQAVIVGEGLAEELALKAAAQTLEAADQSLFPLDLAGVSIVNTGGEGNLSEMGMFFRTLGLSAFAFYDRRKRKEDEAARIKTSFDIPLETPYAGLEALLAAEVTSERQWEYLEGVRGTDESQHGIPASRPDDKTLRALTVSVLRRHKGEGGAADLICICSAEEMPVTIANFLKAVYAKFPRTPSTSAGQRGDAPAVEPTKDQPAKAPEA